MNTAVNTSLESLQQLIETGLAELEFGTKPKELYEPISYILSLGGKRMRPVITLMACEMFEGDLKKALKPALALEVFHNFTLLHDDIMDDAPLRRSKPTVHEKWNTNIALLSGDVMLVLAYQLMMTAGDAQLRHILEEFNDTAIRVCEGQQWDMNFETRESVAIDEYLEMIGLKTAALLAGSLKIGALLGGAGPEDAERIKEFGQHLGLAFQLQDDLLDVFGDPKKFGKRVGGDIVANKKTFLLLKALELAQGEDLKNLKTWIEAKEFDEVEKVDAVKEIYARLNIEELTVAELNRHFDLALNSLEEISVPSAQKEPLRQLAHRLMVREH